MLVEDTVTNYRFVRNGTRPSHLTVSLAACWLTIYLSVYLSIYPPGCLSQCLLGSPVRSLRRPVDSNWPKSVVVGVVAVVTSHLSI